MTGPRSRENPQPTPEIPNEEFLDIVRPQLRDMYAHLRMQSLVDAKHPTQAMSYLGEALRDEGPDQLENDPNQQLEKLIGVFVASAAIYDHKNSRLRSAGKIASMAYERALDLEAEDSNALHTRLNSALGRARRAEEADSVHGSPSRRDHLKTAIRNVGSSWRDDQRQRGSRHGRRISSRIAMGGVRPLENDVPRGVASTA